LKEKFYFKFGLIRYLKFLLNLRPTFKYFSWHTALVGMVASIAMTFIVSLEYAAIAISLLIALIIVLYFRDFPPEWGSISQALIFHQVNLIYVYWLLLKRMSA
jgi:hypothetical protein